MNRFIVSIGCITAIVLSSSAAIAQGRGNGGPKVKTTAGGAPKAGGAAHGGGKPTTTGAGKTSAAHGGGRATHGGTMKGGGRSSTTKAAKATDPKTKSTTTTAATTTPTTSTTKKQTTSETTATTTTLSPVQQKLERNTNLASKLESRLPSGMTLMEASEGFRSLGQFVSTVNASHNHDLDFTKLKTAILEDGMSLGQAMKDQRTSLDGTTEATRATREADVLIQSTQSTETVTATDATKNKTKPRSSTNVRR